MNEVREDFKNRTREIDRYFRFLRKCERELDAGRKSCLALPRNRCATASAEQGALFKTLKANGFLLLYNLVESTLKNAIEAIFDEFRSRGVSFDDCRREVRTVVLTNLRRHNVSKILPHFSTFSTDVVVATFQKSELFRGDVDARRVRDVAKEYGFRHPHMKSDQLLIVKTNRNDLAHGNKSFGDIGRDYDVVLLYKIKREVVAYLKMLLRNVAEYIDTEAYLTRPDSTSTVGVSS